LCRSRASACGSVRGRQHRAGLRAGTATISWNRHSCGSSISHNLGHLFWSQSIRYFTLLLVFELLSVYWFLNGFDGGKYSLLLLSNVAFGLALLTHFSALLLMPVYVAYLFFMICGRQPGGLYNLRGYSFFGLLHGIVLGLMALQFIRFHAILKGMEE